MLAIDIETMGLNMKDKACPITMICIYDPEKNISKSYPFLDCVNVNSGEITDPAMFDAYRQDLVCELDTADSICSFNGVDFDIPFIIHMLDIDQSKFVSWIYKTIDIFWTIKCLFNKWCKLKDMLSINGLEQKSADGLIAIEWARSGEKHLLQEYCMQDTVLTWKLTNLTHVRLPFKPSGAMADLKLYWTPYNKFNYTAD